MDKYYIFKGNHLPQLGIPILIVTVNRNGKAFSEYFLFFTNNKSIQFSKRLNFDKSMIESKSSMFDKKTLKTFAFNSAQAQLRNLLDEKYLASNDEPYIAYRVKFKTADPTTLIEVYMRNAHKTTLSSISEKTKSKSLKELIDFILKLPEIGIEDLKS